MNTLLNIDHSRAMLARLNSEAVHIYDREAALACLGECVMSKALIQAYLHLIHNEPPEYTPVERYILDCIDTIGYNVDPVPVTDIDKLKWLQNTVISEYGHEVVRLGMRRALREYFQGLPSSCNVDFENCKILLLGTVWGMLSENPTTEQEDVFIDRWFSMLAYTTTGLFSKLNIPQTKE